MKSYRNACHCEERSDEAIWGYEWNEITTCACGELAMTNRKLDSILYLCYSR